MIRQNIHTETVKNQKGDIFSIEYYGVTSKNLRLLELEIFHPNGYVFTLESSSSGLKNGVCKEFYSNENIKIDGKYINGNKSGLWTDYF